MLPTWRTDIRAGGARVDHTRGMSKRNLLWLAAIVAVGVVGTIAFGIGWGLVLAVAVLVVSELVERGRRRRRAVARGEERAAPVRDVLRRRRS
jgi:MFS superfamily sulfate permease-like transporter